MTIKEWLTPDFFALNVILIALLMNLVLYATVSNFTEDFKIREKTQTAIYSAMVIMTLAYAVMVLLGFAGTISRYPYLYDNKYNFLLLGQGPKFGGNGPVFIAIVIGAIIGIPMGYLFGQRKVLRISLAVSALASEAIIAAMTLLWIVNQT